MASSDVNMERFAHDVCVHVLEKFGIFKAPDDTRKQNKYVRHDFLPRISRSVVSFAIWMRDDFKNALEDRCKTADLGDNEILWIFDGYLVQNDKFTGIDWIEKVCTSLALCTEYIQFASTKEFTVSLNKLVIGWSEFFEKHLRSYFEEIGGFQSLYNYLEISQIDQLSNFQEAFISEYCLPYGEMECTEELAKECIEKRGFNISLEKTFFGIKKLGYYFHKGVLEKIERSELGNCRNGSEEPKSEEISSGTSDSEEDSCNSSGKSDVEGSQNAGSDASDSEISQNNLLGIPAHEEMLRQIDPFFVENIPSPPKAQSTSKSSERESGSTDVPRSFSKSPEGESGSSDAIRSSSKLHESESGSSDVPGLSPKSPDHESGSSDALGSSSKSPECESGLSDVPRSPSKSPEGESSSSDIPRSSSKSPEGESGSSDALRSSSKSPESESGSSDVLGSSSKSPECESGSIDTQPRSSPEAEELKERAEQILTKLEDDIDELRALLFEHGLLSMKSGRRGSGLETRRTRGHQKVQRV